MSVIITIFVAVACVSARSMSPARAQNLMADTWRSDHHIVWEIDWPASPIRGPIAVEVWRAEDRYRYEILEASAPALVGQILVFDGKNGWRYNRFEPPSTFVPASSLRLSPVTDAFAVIDRLIDTLPETAYPAEAQIRLNPAQKITTSFANGDELSIWRQAETGLPLKVQFSEGGSRATLTARTVEPLADPADELFGVGDWIRNR